MTRVALYARYSDDKQSPASIEDQFLICREQAERQGWRIVSSYKDAAISGASVILRPGIQALLQDAQMGRFDILLAEALDRVSRDQADVATLYKNLQFAGVKIVTLAEGEVSELHVGLKGTMNALFLKDLAKKTHRGLRGASRKENLAGGCAMATMSSGASPAREKRFTASEPSTMLKPKSCAKFSGSSPAVSARTRLPAASMTRALPHQPASSGHRRRSAVTQSAAPVCSTTSSISVSWCGTGFAI